MLLQREACWAQYCNVGAVRVFVHHWQFKVACSNSFINTLSPRLRHAIGWFDIPGFCVRSSASVAPALVSRVSEDVLWRSLCTLYLHACQGRECTSGGVYVPCIYTHARWEKVLLVEFMYLVFTRMPGERMYFWWSVCTLYLHACQGRECSSGGVYVPCIYTHARWENVLLVEFMYLVFTRMPGETVPLAEFMYLVFTRMPGESYRRRLRSLSYLCHVFRALINSRVLILNERSGTRSVSDFLLTYNLGHVHKSLKLQI